MAHLNKWTKTQCPQVLYHDYHYIGRNSKNKNIDPERRKLNYNLAPHDMWSYDYLKQRLSEVYCMNRKDVNVMCSWIFTVPYDVKQEDVDLCLKSAYNFLENKYGKENVVSAFVHKDESKNGRPHIHFNFIPVVWDKKKNRYKVSAKELITRQELSAFHGELQKALETSLGYSCSVISGELSDRPNMSIEHFMKFKEAAKVKDTLARLSAYENTFGFPIDMTADNLSMYLTSYRNALKTLEKPFEKVINVEVSNFQLSDIAI